MSRFKLHNLDRTLSAAFGGMPSEHDHCIVTDLANTSLNPITGKEQPEIVYSGTLKECHEFIKAVSFEVNLENELICVE